jgi:hypothetical protein
VRQTLAKYGGAVRVESGSPGEGTVMVIRLRAVESSPPSEHESAEKEEAKA